MTYCLLFMDTYICSGKQKNDILCMDTYIHSDSIKEPALLPFLPCSMYMCVYMSICNLFFSLNVHICTCSTNS